MGTQSGKEHCCSGDLPGAQCGSAIDYCDIEDGQLWAGNSEYESRVNFCPYCGRKAADQLVVVEKRELSGGGIEWKVKT
jgi:hypothetical protein